ncbi:unnamed protein product [Heligmosomoides polygyrus]|uniref:DUF4780 domain-containing protein n=1 Tax=Heligmosomoides polygyrus TaxID=6339 RepID=A0A3P7WN09_HELPZ|nr:unnamed protein product [Heligmosomoides polygyrus]
MVRGKRKNVAHDVDLFGLNAACDEEVALVQLGGRKLSKKQRRAMRKQCEDDCMWQTQELLLRNLSPSQQVVLLEGSHQPAVDVTESVSTQSYEGIWHLGVMKKKRILLDFTDVQRLTRFNICSNLVRLKNDPLKT